MENESSEERDYREWLESIEFVDKNGKVIPHKLEDDDSEDPENDRGEEE